MISDLAQAGRQTKERPAGGTPLAPSAAPDGRLTPPPFWYEIGSSRVRIRHPWTGFNKSFPVLWRLRKIRL